MHYVRIVFVVFSLTANITATPMRDGEMLDCQLNFMVEAGEPQPPPEYTDMCSTYIHVICMYLTYLKV